MNRTTRWLRTFVAALALTVFPGLAHAQNGTIAGSVTGPDGAPVDGAQISLVGTGFGALTAAEGDFAIEGVPAGSYTLQVTHLAFQQHTETDVSVRPGETTRLDVELRNAAIELGGMVVSASRRVERVTEAPATITRIDRREIERSVGNSFVGALKEVKGLDYVQVGATSAAVNARGFNSSFNNRMLMVTDGRVSVLPESGLPVGQFTTVPKIDLESIEVLVGPGAALYGADASNGVVSLQTKDPFLHQGTTAEVAAGNRSYKNIQFRHADAFGDVAFKVAGEWQEVDDWENRLTYVSGGQEFPEIGIDFSSQVKRVEGAVVKRAGASRFELSGGWSANDGVGQTNVGRNQFDDWTYNFLQFEFSNPNWYVNLYRNQSQSGESYAVNRFTVNRAVMADATEEEVRLASDWPSDGRLMAAEVQNRFELEEARTEVVLGGQYRRDQVSSDREWLTDRLTGEDVTIDQYGFYAQTRTAVDEKLDLVLAARYDEHENYDAQFSPKAGLVFKPAEGQSLRLTFNRAFKSPTILQTNFWIPDFVPFVGVFGNTDGFEIRGADGSLFTAFDPIEPEENTTWELGYKGLLGDRLYVDATLFRADYENFFSPLTIIANPFGDPASLAHFTGEPSPITGETGNPQILLTYFNLGEATLNGLDLGADFRIDPRLNLSATLSLLDLDDVTAPDTPQGEEATALNSPSTKWTLGLDAHDLGEFSGGLTLRHVTGYQFLSGINAGKIPTFNTVDLQVGYEIEETGVQVNLGVSNLFTCRSANPAEDDPDSACGFGEEHMEMINMPSIGTMVFLGVRVHR